MASSRKSYDTDIITLRQINVRTPFNALIPQDHILISDGVGAGYWDSISSIYPVPFTVFKDPAGSTLDAAQIGNVLTFSTVGVQGLMTLYATPDLKSMLFSNDAPPVQVALNPVPTVSRLAASVVPSPETLTISTTQSSIKFIGVGDVLLSTVTDLRAIFISISSFSARGYADLSAESRAWRPYVYSTNSTSAGYATFTSSIPYSTTFTFNGNVYGWDWSSNLRTTLPLSTVEQYPDYYSTGDCYFSSISFNMGPYLQYIHPNSTTKMFLEVKPNYFFQRMYLGQSNPANLIKEFSSFMQYETVNTFGPQIMGKSMNGDYMMSQNNNPYVSNYFNNTIKVELDAYGILSNYLRDGVASANYTLYHRMPGAMANLIPDGYCGYIIGDRGGFSNPTMDFANFTGLSNSVFLHVYNQQGAAPPMPGP